MICLIYPGIAVDGTGKDDKESICLFKKKGKVKALDEELYSESCRRRLLLLFKPTLCLLSF